MLEIKVDGTSVDLPEDIQLSLTIENPLLSKDSIPVPYSLTLELPFTPHNIKLFGFSNRLGIRTRNKKYKCEIFFQAVRISSGSLHIDGTRETIRVNFLGSSINDLTHPLYKNDLGRQEFQGAYIDVNYDIPTNFAHQYKEWASSRMAFQEDYMFSPISIKNEMMPFSVFTPLDGIPIPSFKGVPEVIQAKFRERFENAFQLKLPAISTNKEYINSWNYGSQNFLRGNDLTDKIDKYHSPMFPAFRVGWLLDKILGDELQENLFNEQSSMARNLFLPTFYFPTWKETEASDFHPDIMGQMHNPPMVSNPRPAANKPYPGQPYVELKDFLPNVATNKFIKEVIKLFGITIVPLRGKLYMKKNDDIFSAPVTRDWSNKVLETYDITDVAGKEPKFKYSSSIQNDTEEEVVPVQNMNVLAQYPWDLNEQRSYSQLFFVESTKQYINKTVTEKTVNVLGEGEWTERNMNYEIVRDGFRSDDETDSDYEILESELVPLPDNLAFDFIDLNNRIHVEDRFAFLTPQIELQDRTKRPEELHVTLNQGTHITLPTDFSDAKTYHRLGSFSFGESGSNLSWRFLQNDQHENGLIDRFHKKWSDWVAKDKLKLSATILLDVLDLHNLDITEKIHLDGRNFFVEKIQYTLTKDHILPAEVDFIEA